METLGEQNWLFQQTKQYVVHTKVYDFSLSDIYSEQSFVIPQTTRKTQTLKKAFLKLACFVLASFFFTTYRFRLILLQPNCS